MARKLAAILSADVVGYSRLMGEDEHTTIEALVATREVMVRHFEGHGGRIVDTVGDELMVSL